MSVRWRTTYEQTDQHGDDAVEVHVTPRGGLYENERELPDSRSVQEMMAKMGRFDPDACDLLHRANRGETAADAESAA